MNSRFHLTLLFITLCFIRSAHADNPDLLIENAWIAEAPPVSKVMVAYMTLTNTGTGNIEIIRAESNLFSSIEFHETVHENGMAKMIQHESLTVPGNNKFELKRGGPHMMLFNPTKRLKMGDAVNIKLTTRTNKTLTLSVPVKKAHY